MDDDQQRRLDALHQLAQEQLRAQQAVKEAPSRERDGDSDLVVEPLTPGAKKSTQRIHPTGPWQPAWASLDADRRRGAVRRSPHGVVRPQPLPDNSYADPNSWPRKRADRDEQLQFRDRHGEWQEGRGNVSLARAPQTWRQHDLLLRAAVPRQDLPGDPACLSQTPSSGHAVRSVGEKCSTGAQEPPIRFQGVAVSNGFLYFQMTGDDLPTDLRNTAENALWAKLATSRTFPVPAGDYYATGPPPPQGASPAPAPPSRCRRPWRSLAQPRRRRSSASISSCPGRPIVPDQGGVAPPSGTWLIQDAVMVGWRFTTQGGALVAAPPSQICWQYGRGWPDVLRDGGLECQRQRCQGRPSPTSRRNSSQGVVTVGSVSCSRSSTIIVCRTEPHLRPERGVSA